MDIDVINLVVVLIIGLANLIAVPFVKTLVHRIKELITSDLKRIIDRVKPLEQLLNDR